MAVVAYVAFRHPSVSFLWHNVIGAVAVVSSGLVVSALFPARGTGGAAAAFD
jgi:hypothetical protein